MYHRSIGCIDLISQAEPITQDVAILEEWKSKDAKATEALFRHLTSYALNIVREQTTAKGTWEALKETYEDTSVANRLHLFDKWTLNAIRAEKSPPEEIGKRNAVENVSPRKIIDINTKLGAWRRKLFLPIKTETEYTCVEEHLEDENYRRDFVSIKHCEV